MPNTKLVGLGKLVFSSIALLGLLNASWSVASANGLSAPSEPVVTLLREIPVVEVTVDELVSKEVGGAVYVNISNFTVLEGKEDDDTVQMGNWGGVHGSAPPDEQVSSWHRVTIPPYGTTATGRKLFLDTSIKEAWASYSIQLGSNWTPTDNVKLPGFSGHHNGSWTGAAGGNGGGWGGLCKSWSARTIIARPSSQTWAGRLLQYVYHGGSDNFYGDASASDHPCLNSSNDPVQRNKRQFGESFSGSGDISDNEWHTLTHHVKLNDIGAYNGLVELYLDGVLVSKATDLNFTDNPEYHNIAFWFNVYHGGSADESGTSHDLFFHNFRWNAGSENYTADF